jgi:hypothetical protein
MILWLFFVSVIKVTQLSFGNINNQDLIEIWDSREYREFRGKFIKRAEILVRAYKDTDFDLFRTLDRMKRAEREVKESIETHPLPYVCSTCYKAYGI